MNAGSHRGAAGPRPVALRCERVTHRFPARRRAQMAEALALDRVDLVVRADRVFGLLGPNGAGKTTLLRLVCTLLRPSSGHIEVLGHDPVTQPEAVRSRLGAALGGERSLYWRLTGRENLLYACALHDLPPGVASARAADLLRLVDLDDRADDLVERYSSGMRQRLALARALVLDPPLLVLDEPTAALDPQAAATIRRLLARLREGRTRTILMATHNMLDAEQLCDEVGILDRGRLVACDTPEALKARLAASGDREGWAPSLEDVFLAATGRPFAAADTGETRR